MVMPRSRSISIESSTCSRISRCSSPPQAWISLSLVAQGIEAGGDDEGRGEAGAAGGAKGRGPPIGDIVRPGEIVAGKPGDAGAGQHIALGKEVVRGLVVGEIGRRIDQEL